MAKKDKLKTTALDNYGSETAAAEKTSNVHPNSIANLRPRKPGKSDKKYMQLDIIEFEDYLNRMAKYKGMTRTKYILSLIQQEMDTHVEEYNLLKNLSEYDTPDRSRPDLSRKSKES